MAPWPWYYGAAKALGVGLPSGVLVTETVSSRKTVSLLWGWGGAQGLAQTGVTLALWVVRPPEAGNVAPTAGGRGRTEIVSSFHPPRTLEKEEERLGLPPLLPIAYTLGSPMPTLRAAVAGECRFSEKELGIAALYPHNPGPSFQGSHPIVG